MNWWKKLTKNWQTRDYVMAGFFVLSILISIFVSFNRIMVEQKNRQIELVVDYDDIEKLRAYTGVSMETIYRSLQKAGITSISLQEDTLTSLTNSGKASWISGEEILNSSRIGLVHRLSNLIKTPIKPGFYYVMIDETEIYNRAKNSLQNGLGRTRVKEVGWHVVEINGSAEDVGKIGLGFPARQMQVFKWYKFEVIPRLVSSYRLDDVSLGLKISQLKDTVDIKTVIFTGDSVLGYSTNISVVINKMKWL